jgi:hypothetical protein
MVDSGEHNSGTENSATRNENMQLERNYCNWKWNSGISIYAPIKLL